MKFTVSILIVLLGIASIDCQITLPCDDKRLEIEGLLTQRETLRYDRLNAFQDVYAVLQNLTTHVEELFVAKEAAINAYKAYYTGKIACQGLKQKVDALENATEFSENQCLEAPVSATAENLFNYRLALSGHQENVAYQEDLVDNFYDYKEDYYAEAGLYTTIKGIYTQKIAILQQQYNSCTGAACNAIAIELQNARNLEYDYNNKAFQKQNEATIASQSYTLEFMELTSDKNARDNAQNTYNSEKTHIDQERTHCESELDDEATALNTQLQNVKNLKDTIDAELADLTTGVAGLEAQTQVLSDKSDVIQGKIEELSNCWTAANN